MGLWERFKQLEKRLDMVPGTNSEPASMVVEVNTKGNIIIHFVVWGAGLVVAMICIAVEFKTYHAHANSKIVIFVNALCCKIKL